MSQLDHSGRPGGRAPDRPLEEPRAVVEDLGALSHCEFPKQVQRRKGLLGRFYELFYENFVKPLVLSRNPPRIDAIGVSLGLVVGFLMPLGAHLASLAILRIVLRFNYLVAAGFSVVCNPFNMIPLYYGYYCLGSVFIGKPTDLNFSAFERLMNPITDHAFFWEALPAFLELGSEILIRWFIAAIFLASVFGAVGYVATYKIQQKRCRRAAREMGLRYEEFLDRLNKDIRPDHVL